MNHEKSPLVSIGMPVYNGASYIAGAIESVLGQTMSDLELIICDNASTDDTESICRQFSPEDARIRYYRNDTNLGAHPNYNKTFELSSGVYFKWAPHDDLLDRYFLEKCVDALEQEQDAAVCQSYLRYLDDDDNVIGDYDSRLVGSESPSPARRFSSLVLRRHPCYEVMGVFRRSALEGSLLLQSFHGADRALLAEIALRGRFLQIKEPLLNVRDHKERYTRAQVRPRERAHWHDSRLNSRFSFPTWRLYGEYWRMIGRNLNSPWSKLVCYGTLLAWWGKNWNAARMFVDIVSVLFPGATNYAQRIKQSLISPAPGADEAKQTHQPKDTS